VVEYTDKSDLSSLIGGSNTTQLDAFVTYIDDDIHVFFNKTKVVNHGVIAHESKHIVNLIFKEINYLIDMDNDEVECYLLGWVVNEINKVINEK
jgi:thiaminase